MAWCIDNKTYETGSLGNRDRDRDRESDPPEPVTSTFESRRDVKSRDLNDPRRSINMPSPVGEPRSSSINPSPSGPRSGTFSSRVFTAPSKQSDHAPISSRAPNDLTNLLKAFTQYTDSVVATSNLHFQSNLLKEKAIRQQNLKDRWSKHYHSFVSLAEDHDRVIENAGSIAESFDNQMKHTEEAQEVAVRTLMSTMMAHSIAANPKLDEYTSLRDDVWSLKDGLRATNADLEAAQFEKKRSKGSVLEQEVDQKLRTMSDYEKQMAELTVAHSRLQATVNQHEQLLVQVPDIRDRVHKLNASQAYFAEVKDKTKEALEGIKENKRTCQTLNGDLASQQTSIQSLLKDVESQKVDFKQSIVGQAQRIDTFLSKFSVQRENLTQSFAVQEKQLKLVVGDVALQKDEIDRLKTTVVGDPDDKSDKRSKSLIDHIAEGQEKSEKFEGALRGFDKELESFSEKLGTMENGIRMIEPRAPTQDSASTKVDSASHNLDPNSIDRISSLEELVKANNTDSVERISDLERQSKALEEQQEMKDDFVSAEVERLDNLLITQEKALETLQTDLSALASQASSAAVNKPPTPPPQAESQREPDDSFRLKVEELETTLRHFKESSTERVDAMEVIMESQQQRFDNLSTDQLAKSIIHQMQILYPPHPAGLQAKFDHIKAKQTAVDQHVLNFVTTVNRLSDGLNNQSGRIDHLQQRTFASLEKKCLDVTKGFSDVLQEMERRIADLDAFARTQHNQHALEHLERRFTESPKPPSDTSAGFDRKLADFKKTCLEWFENLDRKFSELKQFSSKRFGEVERNQTELSKTIAGEQLDWRLLSHNLRKDLEVQTGELQNVRASLFAWKTENAAKIASFENQVKTTQTRLDDVEVTTTDEIAAFHGSLSTLKNRVNLAKSDSRAVQDLDSDAPLAQQHTQLKSHRNPTGPTAEKQDRQERQETKERQERQETKERQERQETKERQDRPDRQSRQKAKRKKGASPTDTSESSDSDPPVMRPIRKSNRGIHLTEKKLSTTLRGRSRSGGEHRS